MLPRRLQPGDTIAVVAPSGPFPADRYARGVAVITSRGFRVREAEGLREVHRYLAGTDERRAAALARAFADPDVRGVWAARGGYGAMRLLDGFDAKAAAASGKVLVGFSDVGALHAALVAAGGAGLHGPVVTRLGEEPPESLQRLFAILAGEAPAPIRGRTLVPGRAEGRLAGGCLSVFSRLVGTRHLPPLAGCILLVEDVGEKPYRLDRMWTHLRLAGALDGLAGVAVGQLIDCEEPGASYSAREVMDGLVAGLGVPAVTDLPIGHGLPNLAVPLGARARLEDGALVCEEVLPP